MSVSTIGSLTSSQTDVTQLAKQVAAAIDTNSDGQISSSEFVSFLTQFLSSINTAQGTANTGTTGTAAATSSTSGSSTPSPSDVSSWVNPSSWTSNNAPYDVTLAGFSPQNHTGMSLNDLKDASNGKYAVYDYLVSNQISPSGNWAPAAADALNQATSSTVFSAIDGQTLGYGNEYVHTAPNGYGLQSGQYNPGAVGEFLWGAA